MLWEVERRHECVIIQGDKIVFLDILKKKNHKLLELKLKFTVLYQQTGG